MASRVAASLGLLGLVCWANGLAGLHELVLETRQIYAGKGENFAGPRHACTRKVGAGLLRTREWANQACWALDVRPLGLVLLSLGQRPRLELGSMD